MTRSYKDVDVSNMLLPWWMRTALRFVVKCARNLDARVPQLVFSVTVPEHMFWDMLPAPVLIGRQYTKLCPLAVVVCVRPWAARVSTAQVCVEIFR